MAHIRQSRPDSCLEFRVKALQVVPSSLGRGRVDGFVRELNFAKRLYERFL